MFLLDTNVVSELRKLGDDRASASVTAWFEQHAEEVFFISVVILMELEIGVMRIERRDSEQGALSRDWMQKHVQPAFSPAYSPSLLLRRRQAPHLRRFARSCILTGQASTPPVHSVAKHPSYGT